MAFCQDTQRGALGLEGMAANRWSNPVMPDYSDYRICGTGTHFLGSRVNFPTDLRLFYFDELCCKNLHKSLTAFFSFIGVLPNTTAPF